LSWGVGGDLERFRCGGLTGGCGLVVLKSGGEVRNLLPLGFKLSPKCGNSSGHHVAHLLNKKREHGFQLVALRIGSRWGNRGFCCTVGVGSGVSRAAFALPVVPPDGHPDLPFSPEAGCLGPYGISGGDVVDGVARDGLTVDACAVRLATWAKESFLQVENRGLGLGCRRCRTSLQKSASPWKSTCRDVHLLSGFLCHCLLSCVTSQWFP
jgi:hypothetical protein